MSKQDWRSVFGPRLRAIEALVVALGGSVKERKGSRVKITLQSEEWHCHRPHPGKEARRYQAEEAAHG